MASKEQQRDHALKSRYGITRAEYNRILRTQGGVCAICSTPPRGLDKRGNRERALAVDHDHLTKKIRGLLCVLCNSGLGRFGDNPLLLRRALEYLGG